METKEQKLNRYIDEIIHYIDLIENSSKGKKSVDLAQDLDFNHMTMLRFEQIG